MCKTKETRCELNSAQQGMSDTQAHGRQSYRWVGAALKLGRCSRSIGLKAKRQANELGRELKPHFAGRSRMKEHGFAFMLYQSHCDLRARAVQAQIASDT